MEEFNLPVSLNLPTTPAPPLESLILEITSKTSQRIKSQGRPFFFLFWFVNNVLSQGESELFSFC